MPQPLYKTTIVVWSKTPHVGFELSHIAWEAEEGADYCSKVSETLIESPENDPDWDGTEFFEEDPYDN